MAKNLPKKFTKKNKKMPKIKCYCTIFYKINFIEEPVLLDFPREIQVRHASGKKLKNGGTAKTASTKSPNSQGSNSNTSSRRIPKTARRAPSTIPKSQFSNGNMANRNPQHLEPQDSNNHGSDTICSGKSSSDNDYGTLKTSTTAAGVTADFHNTPTAHGA